MMYTQMFVTMSIADTFNGLFDGISGLFSKTIIFFDNLGEWFTTIKDSINSLIDDLYDKFIQFKDYIADIPSYVKGVYSLIAYMPSFITVFITLSITISLLLLLIGRGRSN